MTGIVARKALLARDKLLCYNALADGRYEIKT